MSASSRDPRARRLLRAAVLSMLLASTAAAAHVVPTASTGARDTDLVRQALRRRGPRDERSHEAVVLELARLDSTAIPALFGVYTGARFEELIGDAQNVEDWWTSPDRFGPLVLEALAAHEPADVLAHLQPVLAGNERIEVQLAALRVLGATGSAVVLPELLATSARFGERIVQFRSVRDTLISSLAAVLEADAEAVGELDELVDDLADPDFAVLLEACVQAGRPECLTLLVAALGRNPALDAQILLTCAALVARAPWNDPIDCIALALRHLDSREPQVVCAAANSLGLLHATKAAPRLARLLGDPRDGVGATAHWALRRMADFDFGKDAAAWTDWFELAHEGWEDRREGLQRAVEQGTSGAALSAVRELAQCRLDRHEAALLLAAAAARTEPEVRTLALLTLRELGSPYAVPPLVEQLERADAAAAPGLCETLNALTGETLPCEPAAWRALVPAR